MFCNEGRGGGGGGGGEERMEEEERVNCVLRHVCVGIAMEEDE